MEMENGSLFTLVGKRKTVIDDCCFSKRAPSMPNIDYIYVARTVSLVGGSLCPGQGEILLFISDDALSCFL
jgi:hypothetical protein